MRDEEMIYLVMCDETNGDEREQNTYALGAFATSYLAKDAVETCIAEDKTLGYQLVFKSDTEAVLESIDGPDAGTLSYRIVKMELID